MKYKIIASIICIVGSPVIFLGGLVYFIKELFVLGWGIADDFFDDTF